MLVLACRGAAPAGERAEPDARPPHARVRVALPAGGGRGEALSDSYPAVPAHPPEEGSLKSDGSEPRVLAMLFGNPITEEDVLRELWERRGRETFDWMIGRDILNRELSRLGLTVSDGEVDERLKRHIADLRAAFPDIGRPDDLVRAASGMSLDEYRERSVWAELALRKIMRVTLKPTEEQLRGYYADRRAEFIQPERVRVSQVFVAPQPDPNGDGIAVREDWLRAERQIVEAHSRLRMGEDFVAVARAYGSGGQLSRWAGRGELLRELEDAAFGIGVGSFTTPIRSSMGYHMLRVEEREERKVPPFEEVRDAVLMQYEEARFVMLAGEFMGRLREKALRDGWLVYTESPDPFSTQ